MSAASALALACAGCACAGVSAGCAAWVRQDRAQRANRRRKAYGSKRSRPGLLADARPGSGLALRYCEALTRRLFSEATQPIAASVRRKEAAETRAGRWYKEHAQAAGCSKTVSSTAFCEARVRLFAAGLLAGLLAGSVFSAELAFALGAAAALAAADAPRRSVMAASRARSVDAQRHLSEMLEVVALGLRSGLTFDRSFALYGSHFQGEFARGCAKAYRSWALGLVSREEALRELSASYDCDQLARVVESVLRSLRLGSPLSGLLEDAAAQSRAQYRTALEERVAKAPVKMMLPTGTLILPAMLLLVMGPILLELAGGF